MGGAAGHMNHPFDCPEVKTGQDLINFFDNVIINLNPENSSVKLDGINVSFKLVDGPEGKEFAVDRGSMKPVDREGITIARIGERFPEGHGMRGAIINLLSILNETLKSGKITSYLEQLGMFENQNIFINTEYVEETEERPIANAVKYNENFIALHGTREFFQATPKRRASKALKYNKQALQSIADELSIVSQKFNVYGPIDESVELVGSPNFGSVLASKVQINYTSDKKGEEGQEDSKGESRTLSLSEWLRGAKNPGKTMITLSNGRKLGALHKDVYDSIILQKLPLMELVQEGDEKLALDGAIFWHAIINLGQQVLENTETKIGPANLADHEGMVLDFEDMCSGELFKITGQFIISGREGAISKVMNEEVDLNDMSLSNVEKYVILIPGGFKPPTGGHYSMIKQYESKSDVIKVLVITGPKAREGVTLQQSKAIFDIYGGFSDKVEFMSSNDPTPLKTCYELMENDEFVSQFGDVEFSIGASNKGSDPKRIQGFVSYFDQRPELSKANISAYAPAEAHDVAGAPASASRMRKAFRDGDWETFKKLLPDDNFYDDVVQVMNGQRTDVSINPGGSMVAENFLLAYPPSFLVNEVYSEKQRRFMCAVKDQPASKRPKGLSAAEAEEMCKSKGLKRVAEQEGESAIQLKMDSPILQAFETEIEQFVKNIENDTGLDMNNPDVQAAIINSITSIIKDKFGGGINEISVAAGVQGAISKAFIRKQNNDDKTRINRRSKA